MLCGDFLFSGHTVTMTLLYLFIKECKSRLVPTGPWGLALWPQSAPILLGWVSVRDGGGLCVRVCARVLTPAPHWSFEHWPRRLRSPERELSALLSQPQGRSGIWQRGSQFSAVAAEARSCVPSWATWLPGPPCLPRSDPALLSQRPRTVASRVASSAELTGGFRSPLLSPPPSCLQQHCRGDAPPSGPRDGVRCWAALGSAARRFPQWCPFS